MDTPTPAKSITHDAEHYGWATEQARLLRAGRLDSAELETLADGIESMAAAKSAS